MKVGILRLGKIDSYVITRIQENLQVILPKTKCLTIPKTFAIPKESFNEERQQYNSSIVLSKVQNYAEKERKLNRVLGIVDVDIFVPNLNFVFGEATLNGKVAIISLWRLRPEFYRKSPNIELFAERATKEAVHEVGHTLGLSHCLNPFCVMYFSNSIFDTDRKESLFCNKCYLKVEKLMEKLGGES